MSGLHLAPLTESCLAPAPYLGIRLAERGSPISKKDVTDIIKFGDSHMRAYDLMDRNSRLPIAPLNPFKRAINRFSHCYRDDSVIDSFLEHEGKFKRAAQSVIDKVMTTLVPTTTPLETLQARRELYLNYFYHPLQDKLESIKTFPYTSVAITETVHPLFLTHMIHSLPTDGSMVRDLKAIENCLHRYVYNDHIPFHPPLRDWSDERLIKEITTHISPEIREARDKGEKYFIQAEYLENLESYEGDFSDQIELLYKIQNLFVSAIRSIPRELDLHKERLIKELLKDCTREGLETQIEALQAEQREISGRSSAPQTGDLQKLLDITTKTAIILNKKTTLSYIFD